MSKRVDLTGQKFGIIYRATNNKNGKIYIGQTIRTLDKRKSGHYVDSRRGSSKINRAIAKYGIGGFTWEVLHNNVLASQLDYLEQYEICMHGSYENGYNTTIGGDVNPMKGKRHSEESRRKISKGLTGRRDSKKTLEKKRRAGLGKILSEETKIKISKNHADVSGKNNPMYGRSVYSVWVKKFGKDEAERRKNKFTNKLSKSIKGTMVGEKNPHSKLTFNIVDEIREKYKTGKYKAYWV